MADRDYPILFTLLGLNRAGQVLYIVLIFVGFGAFMAWTQLPGLQFTEQDEALFRAARHGDRAGVERAIDAGAQVNHEAPVDRKTALFRAAVFGHADVVRLLIDRGADPKAVGGDGRTALDLVREARQQEKDSARAQGLDAVAAVLNEAAAP